MMCDTESRRSLAIDSNINGIDYIEVITSPSEKSDDPYQALLIIRCFHPIAEKLDEGNVSIAGGSRIKNIGVLWAGRADEPIQDLGPEEQTVVIGLHDKDRVLLARPSARGDFSTYTLSLVRRDDKLRPPPGFDEQLSKMEFSFKVECHGDFDCLPQEPHEEQHAAPAPQIDYMAKDYASFRRLMLNRLATLVPAWKERNPADAGVALVELLAYVGDHLSYYQDAVAAEAYLGTARRRVSIRRHARLLSYCVHDGCNARVWVFIRVDGNVAETLAVPAKTRLLAFSKAREGRAVVRPRDLPLEIAEGAKVFETMHDAVVNSAHNKILFHTWGDDKCYLPKGATSATLQDRDKKLSLKAGDLVLFEEVIEGSDDAAKNAQRNGDMTRRHIVRLTHATPKFDQLLKMDVLEIEWHQQDALPFVLCVREEQGKGRVKMAVARGNIVLADHGMTIFDYDGDRIFDKKEEIGIVPVKGKFRPKLPNREPLTYAAKMGDAGPASIALEQDPRDALPQILLQGNEYNDWKPVRDLLNSDRQAYEFVVETESDGSSYVRFGDSESKAGRIPAAGTKDNPAKFSATFRTGNGTSGNVGAETITAIVWDTDAISEVRNPMDAKGGLEPEDIEKVRQFAPSAFMKQERAVTERDYEEVLGRRDDIQKARATIRWTGSWHTVFVAIDRVGGIDVDTSFEQKIREYLESYRLTGYDLEVHGAAYVPLKISLNVRVAKGYFRDDVQQALADAFGSHGKGFFHPDNFTFGQPVFLSQIYAAAGKVHGVQAIEVTKFGRMDRQDDIELQDGVIMTGKFEIARLDSDPEHPENGSIEFHMEGGK